MLLLGFSLRTPFGKGGLYSINLSYLALLLILTIFWSHSRLLSNTYSFTRISVNLPLKLHRLHIRIICREISPVPLMRLWVYVGDLEVRFTQLKHGYYNIQNERLALCFNSFISDTFQKKAELVPHSDWTWILYRVT